MNEPGRQDDHAESGNGVSSGLYDAIQSLPLTVKSITFEGNRIETESRAFERTTIQLHGDRYTGVGEDTTPSIEAHEHLRTEGLSLPKGDQTVGTFSTALDTDSQLVTQTIHRETRNHLRWAIESAALDLALKQSNQTLATVLDRTYESLAFVASLQLGDPPSIRPVRRLLETIPGLEFKIDVPGTLSESLLAELRATDAVRVLDLKGQYGSDVGAPADPELYRRLFEAFPDALIEDPTVTDTTRDVLEAHSDRIAWDAPITSIESVRELPWDPTVLNVKPCRFGTLESLFSVLDYALEHDIELYGGGMFELNAGRLHAQALASLFYPDSPNDLAPPEYHWFESGQSLPSSPLDPPSNPSGIGWYS